MKPVKQPCLKGKAFYTKPVKYSKAISMAYKTLLRFFCNIGTKYLSSYLSPLKEEIAKSNLTILYEVYIGRMLMFSTLAFLIVFISTSAIFMLVTPIWFGIISGLILGSISFMLMITVYHSYPFQLLTSKKNDIEANMPFAINHMAAIASSGVPPLVVFKLLTNVHEYGEIMYESRRIVRNVEAFGMDLTTSLKNVVERTPSDRFRQFLNGIISTTETGGDLKKFFENSAKDAMFEYRIARERYLQTLSTYADFYTAVLIAAPLFFISILAVMALVGGQIMGMNIPTAMRFGIYLLIPLLNTAFLAFIHYTQPRG